MDFDDKFSLYQIIVKCCDNLIKCLIRFVASNMSLCWETHDLFEPQWVKKVFVRNGGATKGRGDRYWYSPKEKYKLRSMVQVKRFLKALAENNGNEIKAKSAMGKL